MYILLIYLYFLHKVCKIIFIKIWSLSKGVCEGVLEGHGDAVTCLSLAVTGADPANTKVITGSLDRLGAEYK